MEANGRGMEASERGSIGDGDEGGGGVLGAELVGRAGEKAGEGAGLGLGVLGGLGIGGRVGINLKSGGSARNG